MQAKGRRVLEFAVLTGSLLLTTVLVAPASQVAPEPQDVEPSLTSVVLPVEAGDSESGLVTAAVDTEPFRLVGLSWDDEALQDVVAEVSYRSAGSWSGWYTLEAEDEHAPDPGSTEAVETRGGTEPLLVPSSDGVRVRVDVPEGVPVEGLRVDVVDPGTSSADSTVAVSSPGSARAAAPQPRVYSRNDWGADESLRETIVEYGTIQAGVVHHTVSANSYQQDEVPAMIRAIYAFHVKSRGWRDIGYNFIVDRFGRIWEGRHGGVEKPVIGAHTSGFNSVSFSASALGTYTDTEPTSATLDAFANLFAWKFGVHGIDPTGSVVLNGRNVNTVLGHRDANATACPGDRLYARLPQIRSQTASVMAASSAENVAAVGNFVDAVFRDFLSRAPGPAERSAVITDILSNRVSRYGQARRLASTDEWIATRVTEFYRETLGRKPDAAGLAGWVRAVKAGMPIEQVAAGFYASGEYYRGFGGGTNRGWVTDLYRKVLEREPDPAGLAGWVNALERGMSRESLAAGFYRSPESLARRVDALYVELLGRRAEPGGIRSWSPFVKSQGDLVLAAALAGSQEYFSRAQRR